MTCQELVFVSRTAMVHSHNFSYALRLLFAADAGRRHFFCLCFCMFCCSERALFVFLFLHVL